jgi:hypothetical protein
MDEPTVTQAVRIPASKSQTMEEALADVLQAKPRCLRRALNVEDVSDLFRRRGPAHLWITDQFGFVIERVEPQWCFHFWKHELKTRLMEDGFFMRELWPECTAYEASEWESPYRKPLLELRRFI